MNSTGQGVVIALRESPHHLLATTMVEVRRLANADHLVEIEVDAVVSG